MTKFLIFLLFLVYSGLFSSLSGQNYQLNNALNGTTVNTCSGNFYDSGGPGGVYNNNQNLTVTFCPSIPGQVITVSFSQLMLETGFDRLRVYDGPNTSSALIGNNTGNVGAVSYTSTFGCLTFRFTSDGSVTQAGWQAVISCSPIPPCAGLTPSCPSGFPDDCSTACPLSLGTPANCNNPSNSVFCLDNTGASQEAGSMTLNGCSPSGNVPVNPYDMWYSFTATSSAVNIDLVGLTAPAMALYSGTCGNLEGVGCATGLGSASMVISAIVPGQTYFLQISSSDPLDTGEITLIITSSNPCNPCAEEANLVVSPSPINGSYAPGTVVQFCFEMTEWNDGTSNWFHGVGLTIGNGWDVSSLNVISLPPPCDNNGAWGFFNSVTSNSTGLTVGPGFFFETGGSMNGNPGNNWGDFCPNQTNPWLFCWELTVADCGILGNGAAANIAVNSYGDNETGSWSSGGCEDDPVYTSFATVDCCEEPDLISMIPASCGNCDGAISIQANGTAPFSYTCTDSNGSLVSNGSSASASITITGLCGNEDFTVLTLDGTGCSSFIEVNVTEPGAPTAIISGGANLCPGQSTDIEIALTGTPPWTINYEVSGTPQTVNVNSSPYVITNAPDGIYELISVSDGICSTVADGSQIVLTSALSATITGGGVICAGENTDLSVSFTGSGPWTIIPSYNGNPLPAQTVASNPYNVNVSQAGTFSLISVSNASCTGTVSGSAVVSLNAAVNAFISGDLDLCSGQVGNIPITLTGSPPWNILYQIDGNAQPGITTGLSPYVLAVSQAGTYSLTSVSNAQCDGNISGSAIVTIHDNPTVNNIIETCNGFDYTVSFTIAGGDVSSYVVTGAGTLVGATFISDPIPSGTPYSFQITDLFLCAPVDVSGNFNCDCPAAAVLSGADNICLGETGELTVDLTGTGPWTLIYAWDGIPQAPLIIGSSPYALTGLSSGAYTLVSVEDQACLGSVSGSGSVSQAAEVTATISGGGNLCAGEILDLMISCTGSGPWQVSPLLDGVPQAPINISSSPYSYTVSQAGSYTLSSIVNTDCPGTVSGGAVVTSSGAVTASITGDLDLCDGEIGNLTISLTGDAPWDIIYAIDGTLQPMISTSDVNYNLNVTQAGLYTLVNVSSGSCTGIVSGSATVEVHDSPNVSAITETCNGFLYTVNFTLAGGDASTYTVTGLGSLAGNVFTSDPIISGTSYNFEVSDLYACAIETVTGAVNCGCPASAVLSGTETICDGELGSLTLTLQGNGPWTVGYAHDGIPQVPLIVSSSPYIITGLSPGQFTLLSVEDQDCIGNTSGFGEILTQPEVSAVLSGSGEICAGGSLDFMITCTGTAPWELQYAIDGIPQGIISTSNEEFVFTSSAPGAYTMVSVSDANCSGSATGNGSLVILPSPTAIISGTQDLCSGETASIEILFTGVAPFEFEYNIDGIPQASLTSSATSYTLETTTGGVFDLIQVTDQSCNGTVSGAAFVTLHSLPSAMSNGNIELCEGESGAAQINLEGAGPWVLEYSIAGDTQNPLLIDQNPYELTVDENGPYQLLTVSDAYCIGTADGYVEVDIHPLPTALLPDDQTICPGESLNWDMILSGSGPWNLNLLLDGSEWITLQSESNVVEVESTVAGTVSIASLSDSFCEAIEFPVLNIDASVIPSATIVGGGLLCEGSTADIEVQFSGTGPFSFGYSLNGVDQGVFSVNSDSYSFPLNEAAIITLTSLSDMNCIGDASPSLNIISQEIPVASLTGDTLLCQGEVTSFPVALAGSGPFDLVYAINGLAQAMISTSDSSINLPANEEGSYSLVSLVDQYCPGTVNGQAELAFYPDIIIQGLLDTSLCTGSALEFTPLISGGQESDYSFQWTGPGLDVQSQNITVSPIESAVYLLEVSDACDIIYAESVHVDVSIPQLLTASILNSPLCGPSEVVIQSGNVFEENQGFCYWFFQGDTVFDCNGARFLVNDLGTYDLGYYAEPVPGCVSDTVFQGFIEILALPHADFYYNPSDPTNVENVIQFIDLSTYAHTYAWYLEDELFSEAMAPSLALPYSELTEFWPICLVITHENTCTDTLCTSIASPNELLLFIPNAFTPDDDGVNDYFKPILRSADIDRYTFSIFNRWGNMIWSTTDLEEAWNGAGTQDGTYFAPDGAYAWKIHVRRVGSSDEREYTGMITLIR